MESCSFYGEPEKENVKMVSTSRYTFYPRATQEAHRPQTPNAQRPPPTPNAHTAQPAAQHPSPTAARSHKQCPHRPFVSELQERFATRSNPAHREHGTARNTPSSCARPTALYRYFSLCDASSQRAWETDHQTSGVSGLPAVSEWPSQRARRDTYRRRTIVLLPRGRPTPRCCGTAGGSGAAGAAGGGGGGGGEAEGERPSLMPKGMLSSSSSLPPKPLPPSPPSPTTRAAAAARSTRAASSRDSSIAARISARAWISYLHHVSVSFSKGVKCFEKKLHTLSPYGPPRDYHRRALHHARHEQPQTPFCVH